MVDLGNSVNQGYRYSTGPTRSAHASQRFLGEDGVLILSISQFPYSCKRILEMQKILDVS